MVPIESLAPTRLAVAMVAILLAIGVGFLPPALQGGGGSFLCGEAWQSNLAMHALSCLAFLGVLRRILGKACPQYSQGKIAAAALGAVILFAIHPLRAEVVFSSGARSSVLAGFFFLGSILAYLWYLEGRRRLWLLLSLAAYAAAVSSIAAALVLPLCLVVLDVYPWRRASLPVALREKVLYLLAGVLTMLVMPRIGQHAGGHGRSGADSTVLSALEATAIHTGRTVLPVRMGAAGSRPSLEPRSGWGLVVPFLFGAVSALIVLDRRKRPWLVAAWSVCLLCEWSIAMCVSSVPGESWPDRETYVATLPIHVLAGAVFLSLGVRRGFALAIVASAALLPVTWTAAGSWRREMPVPAGVRRDEPAVPSSRRDRAGVGEGMRRWGGVRGGCAGLRVPGADRE